VTRMLPAQAAPDDLQLVRQGGADLQELAGVLGVVQQDAQQYMQRKKQQLLAAIELSADEIDALIAQRKSARDRKDWAAGDAVRDELLAHNIELHDGPDGTTWDVKS